MAIVKSETFYLDVDKFSDHVLHKAQDVARLTALSLYQKIVKKTPVKTGAARNSWVVGIGKKETNPGKENPGDKFNALQASKILNSRKVTSIFISNYRPYINLLEHGSSLQAPSGMVRLSLYEVQNDLRGWKQWLT